MDDWEGNVNVHLNCCTNVVSHFLKNYLLRSIRVSICIDMFAVSWHDCQNSDHDSDEGGCLGLLPHGDASLEAANLSFSAPARVVILSGCKMIFF